MPNTRPLVIVFLAASAFMYVMCLPHQVVCTGGGCSGGWSGFFVAAFGWLEIIGIGRASLLVVLSWYANPAVWTAWGLLFGRLYIGAAAAALIALILALGYRTGTHILVSESGGADAISGVGAGYWLWVASMGLAFTGALVGLAQRAEERPRTIRNHRPRRQP